jgi:hypothetical protein
VREGAARRQSMYIMLPMPRRLCRSAPVILTVRPASLPAYSPPVVPFASSPSAACAACRGAAHYNQSIACVRRRAAHPSLPPPTSPLLSTYSAIRHSPARLSYSGCRHRRRHRIPHYTLPTTHYSPLYHTTLHYTTRCTPAQRCCTASNTPPPRPASAVSCSASAPRQTLAAAPIALALTGLHACLHLQRPLIRRRSSLLGALASDASRHILSDRLPALGPSTARPSPFPRYTCVLSAAKSCCRVRCLAHVVRCPRRALSACPAHPAVQDACTGDQPTLDLPTISRSSTPTSHIQHSTHPVAQAPSPPRPSTPPRSRHTPAPHLPAECLSPTLA